MLAAGAPTESAAESAKRLRLEAEWQELREREENLRAYEAQLRAMQADIDAYELMARGFLTEVENELAELDARAGAAA